MPYKVLRLLEYTYSSVGQADVDMARWQIPASGARNHGGGRIIRSVVLQYPEKDVFQDLGNLPEIPDQDKLNLSGQSE